jgi:hypothetical protein
MSIKCHKIDRSNLDRFKRSWGFYQFSQCNCNCTKTYGVGLQLGWFGVALHIV